MEQDFKCLEKERNKILKKLTKGFSKEQFILLLALIDVEIELEKFCNE